MPKGREKSWSELRLGIAVVALGMLAGLVVFFAGARRGPFLPDTYTLYLDLREAGGVRVGSPVRVGGIPAGEVADVEIIPSRDRLPPAASDTLEPLTGIPELRDIRIELSVQERFRPYVTSSSRAQLASLGLGGERYVQISPGDVREPSLAPGSEIPAVASVDWDLLLAKLSRAFNEMREIAEISEAIRGRLAEGGGTVPRFLDRESPIYGRIAAVQVESESLLATLEGGRGIVPRWSSDPRLERGLDSLVAGLGRVSAEIEREEGALAQWAEADELRAALEETRDEVARLNRALDSGRGTAGMLLNDTELWVQIRVLQLRVAEFVEAFRADPLQFVDIDLF